jgi:predicted TIM-barrel fold metal-dependent hydrolase
VRDIPFVDAHVHLWDLARLRYPWLTPPFSDAGPNGSVEPIAATYLLDDYREDAGSWNVAGIVHVEAGAEAASALAETHWLQEMAQERGQPDGIVAFAALDDPMVEGLLEAHARHDRVRAVRHIVNWHADPRRTYTARDVTLDAGWARGFALLEKYDLSFDLQAYAGQFAGLASLFARHDATQIVVNHMGMPVDRDEAGRASWQAGMTQLAALPHVAVKISGAGFVERRWSAEFIEPYVLDAIDLFGTERVLFASDFPTDKLFGSFDATLAAYAQIIAPFSEAERRDMWGGNANRIYRLGLDLQE